MCQSQFGLDDILHGCTSVQETQTKPEGQIHFFPVLFKGDKLYDLLVERCGPSQTSAPES